MRNTDHDTTPYTPPAEKELRQRGKDEYAKLAAKKSYDDRVKKGIGLDWQQIIKIDQ